MAITGEFKPSAAAMKYTVYSIRWLFVAALNIGVFNYQFTTLSYGAVNNVITSFLEETPYATDALPIIAHACGIFVMICLIIFANKIGVRKQLIFGCVCAFLGMLCNVLGFINRETYYLLLIGNSLVGISGGVFYVLPMTLAASWFAVNERATVIGMAWLAGAVGDSLSGALFSGVFGNATNANVDSISPNKIQQVFASTFGVLCFLLFVSTISMWIFAVDHPPSPPTSAQQNIIKQGNEEKETSWIVNLKTVVHLLRTPTFLLLTTSRALTSSIFAMTKVLNSSMILRTFPGMSDSFPGLLRTIGACLAALTSIATGRFLDSFGYYKESCIVSFIGIVLCSLGIFLGHYFKNIIAIGILYPSLMAIRLPTGVVIPELLLEATYPVDNLILMALYFIPLNAAPVLFVSLERFILEVYGEAMASLVPVIANSLALFLLLLGNPKYKRSAMDMR
ncbi:choline/ethanolamine transporter FLVCR2-like [Styela clava]